MNKSLVQIIIAVILLTSCTKINALLSPCNEDILNLFLNTKMDGFPEAPKTVEGQLTYMAILFKGPGVKVEEPHWTVEERDEGCIVSLYVKINGKDVRDIGYYIDLESMRAFADDEYARAFTLYNFPDGIPLKEQK